MLNHEQIFSIPVYRDILGPIASAMTQFEIEEKMIGHYTEEDKKKRPDLEDLRKQCIHITITNGVPNLRLKKNHEGKLICSLCKRPVYHKFDDSNVNIIMDATAVVNQVLTFGVMYEMDPEDIRSLINLKRYLPRVASMAQELNKIVTRENKSADSADNLGVNYLMNSFRNITEM